MNGRVLALALAALALVALLHAAPTGAAVLREPGASGCAVDPSLASAPSTVLADHGAVQGVQAGGSLAFKGIPYAAPPVGPLRFRPPAEAACWSGMRDGTAFGPQCIQQSLDGVAGDEDCLTLNVWTPAGAVSGAAGLPVMFFIHGGGNATGAGSLPAYDGGPLVEREHVVIVTINYRLGALGFLVLPALDAESPNGVSGNYGILDQIAALRWVQRNIAAFGGDPARVLIFGESAGGVDVCVLVASPLASGLFARALIESGGCVARPLAAEEQAGAKYAAAAGCADASDVTACLRGLSAADSINAMRQDVSVVNPRSNLWHPNVDGYVLTGSPLDVLRAGAPNPVPLVVGANADETNRYVPFTIRTEDDYRRAVYALAGTVAGDQILARYPASAFASPRLAYVAVTTDANFVCQARLIARAAAAGQQPVYRYFFTHAAAGAARIFGAFHGLELAYVFGTLGAGTGYTPTTADMTVSNAMMDYWARFAATGDPGAAGGVAWPAYDAGSDPYLLLDDPVSAGAGVRTDRCDFWDALLNE